MIEILSPEDTYSELKERCDDYRKMGVEAIWIIDPKNRAGRMCSGDEWVRAERLVLAGTPLAVDLSELFARLAGSAGS